VLGILDEGRKGKVEAEGSTADDIAAILQVSQKSLLRN